MTHDSEKNGHLPSDTNPHFLAPHPDMILCGINAYMPFRVHALPILLTDLKACQIIRDYANLSAEDRRGWEAHGCALLNASSSQPGHEEPAETVPTILTEKRSNYIGTLIFILLAIWVSADLIGGGHYIWATAALIGMGGLLPLSIILIKRRAGGAENARDVVDRSLNVLEGFGAMSARMAGVVVNTLSMRKLTIIFILGFFALALFLGYFGKELTP